MNISSVDEIVQEYCIYRGFTQSFRSIEFEKSNDKTKNFEPQIIVQQIFDYLNNGNIDQFLILWDFLQKRFFIHLDQEHVKMFYQIKSDLIKYYLVICVKLKNKSKISDFFSCYSNEILSANNKSDLRNWYVLPYLENPDKDKDFNVYFSLKWTENLKTVLFNYISLVLRYTPPPRLLLLERWFRSETQQEIRSSLEISTSKIDAYEEAVDRFQIRNSKMYNLIKKLFDFITIEDNYIEKDAFPSDSVNSIVKLLDDCIQQSENLNGLKKDQRLKALLGINTIEKFSSEKSATRIEQSEDHMMRILESCLEKYKSNSNSKFNLSVISEEG